MGRQQHLASKGSLFQVIVEQRDGPNMDGQFRFFDSNDRQGRFLQQCSNDACYPERTV